MTDDAATLAQGAPRPWDAAKPTEVVEYVALDMDYRQCERDLEQAEAERDEALRLLRAVRRADVIFAKGDWPLSQNIHRFLRRHDAQPGER